jgi:hypothetical protein
MNAQAHQCRGPPGLRRRAELARSFLRGGSAAPAQAVRRPLGADKPDISRDGSLVLMEDSVVQAPVLLAARIGAKHPFTTIPERCQS